MTITRATVAGAVIAFAGQALAAGVTAASAIAAGGGPNADLDAGGRLAALLLGVVIYGIAQLVLLGCCVALSGRLGHGSWAGLVTGWALGLALSLYYLCGGFGA
ncbi:hypothetical protein ACH495_27480 [Micromonospora sp. NPDC018662]|uniref:hypothetical protein n=1 Tax=Micromonospora sp. NPDC018662 TaxID=3364238 RepID=UPI0037A2BBC3